MNFSLWRQYGSLNSRSVWDAFEQGAKALGHSIVYNKENADVDVIWSVLWNGRMAPNHKIWRWCKQNQKPVIVLEVGAIQRGTTWRIGLGGINRNAYFAPGGNSDSRARSLGLTLRPWRNNGDHILICGQHEKSQQWQSMPPISKWLTDTVSKIKQYSNRTIVFRPHPRSPLTQLTELDNVVVQRPQKKSGTYDDFDIKFDKAWAVVCESSNPGPQAVINGIPAFVSTSSLAYDVANTDLANIENPCMPYRQQWLNDYAYTEHTLSEIQQGIPLAYLTQVID